MFTGGTNFGFTNGANDKGVFQPTVTSYDYDAPLSESGEVTPKYLAFREVLARYAPVPADLPAPVAPAPAFAVALDESVSLWDALPELADVSVEPVPELPSMDALGQYTGFALYRSRLVPGARVFSVGEVRDRAQVFVDGNPVGVLQRDHHDRSISLPAGERVDLLVEDQGRVNYGPRIGEHKGLIGPVTLDGAELGDWQVLPLDVDGFVASGSARFAEQPGNAASLSGPVFARGRFDAEPGVDLFLSTAGWGKGQAWINGFNLGRFWDRGPQTTLYVPGPVLRASNELVILCLHGTEVAVASFVPRPDLGHTDY